MADHGKPYVQPFSAIDATDVAYAGGKGATLARLFQAGLPVPPGCVLSPEAFPAFLAAQHVSSTRSPDDICQVLRTAPLPAALETDLGSALAAVPAAPHGWAVRSSAVSEDHATTSYAGVYESFLEIPAEELWAYIRACWASWWSERAVGYRRQVGETDATPRMAVVLQHMVPARYAGVAFTAEPLHGDRTRMVINAASGLGVAVVSGIVQPEQYTLAKTPDLRLLETRLLHPNGPPLLPLEVVLQLGALCQRLETLCGSPQDVEWAWDGTVCWIVQSRPITTLGDAALDGTADVWGNANLKDVIPGLVSPFSWSLMQPQLEGAMRQQYARAGYLIPPERPLLRRFWGRPYFNISLFNEAGYALYGATPELQAAQLGGMVPPGARPPASPSLRQRLRWLRNILRFVRIANRAAKVVPTQFAMVQQRWREERQSLPYLDRAALLEKLEHHADVTQPFLELHLHLSWAMSGNFSALRDIVARAVPQVDLGQGPSPLPSPSGRGSAASLAAELVTGIGDVSSAEHSYRLWELSRLARQSPQVMVFLAQGTWDTWQQELAGTAFAKAWQEFLETFGHRAVYEVEMANPRWREQPDYLFEVLATYAGLPQAGAPFDPGEQARRRQAAEQEVCRLLTPWRRAWFRATLRRTQTFSRLRENSKSHLVQLIDIGRLMALRAAHFLVRDGLLEDAETIFYLRIEEVQTALRGAMPVETVRHLITQRRLERQRNAARHLPDLFVGERPLYAESLPTQGTVLTGLPSSPGRVTGIARVLYSPQEGARLQPGEILVAPSTDPGWTPLFLLASGLVMETGGYLSHGAIVAREYGIPAVLNIPLATKCIPDGSSILLDGAQGVVQVLPPT
jgi:phosphohistidine swiveling domain-containing protein